MSERITLEQAEALKSAAAAELAAIEEQIAKDGRALKHEIHYARSHLKLRLADALIRAAGKDNR
jgi:hypothetical protein